MSTPFQNRLVGTIIVAAVAIIFLPDLLDGEKKSYQEEFDKIPAAPSVELDVKPMDFPEGKLEKLNKAEIVEEIALDDNIVEEETASSLDNEESTTKVNRLTKEEVLPVKSDEPTKRIPNKITTDHAWVIQLGSFRHKKNVDELVQKLKSNGYSAFTKPIKTRNGTLTKVFVGPELVKGSLEKKIPTLKALTNVEGKLARFNPAKK